MSRGSPSENTTLSLKCPALIAGIKPAVEHLDEVLKSNADK